MRRPLGLLQALVFVVLLAILALFYWDIEAVKWLPAAAAADGFFGLPTGDFANLWSAGTLARHGQLAVLYDVNGFTAWKALHFGHGVREDDWIYPPMALPLAALASLLPIWCGFALWSVATLAAMALLLRMAGLGWPVILLSLACPAEILCLIYGQYGGIISCLVFTGLVVAAARPVAAGVLIGLVTLKPQTGLLMPFAWLATRNWRAVMVAGALIIVLAAVPLLWFGPASWVFFLLHSTRMASALVTATFGQGYQLTGTSVFWMLRSFGFGIGAAYAVQAVAACLAALAVYRLWRKPGDRMVQASLTMFLALFVAPYGFSVDMVGYSIALAVLAQRRGWRVTLLDGLFWLWPGYAALITGLTGVLLTPLVIAAALLVGWVSAPGRGAGAGG
jgi:hypothetical protein